MLKKRGTDFVENGKYWYAIKSKEFSAFKPIARIELTENNKLLIEEMEGMIKNERNSKRLINSIDEVYQKWQHLEGNSIIPTKRGTTNTNDTIFSEKQGEENNRGNDIEQNGRVTRNSISLDNSFSLLTNKKETNLGTYQDGLSKTDKSYRYNKVISYDIKNGGKGDNGNTNTIYNIGKLAQRKRPVISGSSVKNGANGSLTTNNIP